MMLSDSSIPYIIIGGGGHAKVLIDMLQEQECKIIGYTEMIDKKESILGITCIGSDDEILKYNCEDVFLVNGVGSTGDQSHRKNIYESYTSKGYIFPAVVSASASISRDAEVGIGVQIMRGALIQPGVKIDVNVIVNTGVMIDHDCIIGKHVHIAPGVTISGGVTIDEMSHIGTGAKIIQGINIGREALVAAGAVVINNVSEKTCVKGVPAKRQDRMISSE